MEFHLAVPSYRRAEAFGKKTYAFLKRSGSLKPTVYVADNQDYEAYKVLYPELDIRIAVKGLTAARKFIMDNQPLGQHIVMMDDDIEEVVALDLTMEKPKKKKVRNFQTLIENAFACMVAAGTTLWGVHPTDNGLTMKPIIRRNLCYLVGAFYGFVNDRTDVCLEYCEDFERSIKYWKKEGRLCRLEFVGIQTKYYQNEGGLQETRNELLNTEYKHRLAEEYPTLCKTIKRKSRTEIRLRRYPCNAISCKSKEGIVKLEREDASQLVWLPPL